MNGQCEHWIHWAHMDLAYTQTHYLFLYRIYSCWWGQVLFAFRLSHYNKIHATRLCLGFCTIFNLKWLWCSVFHVPCWLLVGTPRLPKSYPFNIFACMPVRNVHIICGQTQSAHNKRKLFGQTIEMRKTNDCVL